MNPTFSIIIPTKDRPGLLAACLRSIAQLDFPREEYEVLVVNDGGVQSLAGVIEQLEGDLPIRYFHQPLSGGPAAARNTGAEQAGGKYLVFLDDDCYPDPLWLRALETDFLGKAKDALAGRTRNPTPEVIGAQAWCLVVAFQYHYWQDQVGNLKIAISNNFAVERQAFCDSGGFDPAYPQAASEDRDFSWRFNEAGYRIGYSPAAVVWHAQPDLDLFSYLKLQHRYGYYAGMQKEKQNSATAAEFRERFGSASRLRYLSRLLSFAVRKRASFPVIVVVLLGHVSHFLGRVSRALEN